MIPRPVQQDVTVQPIVQSLYISLVLPFEPRNTPKSVIEQRLKQVSEQVENELNNYGPKQVVKPLLHRLQLLFQGLDYNASVKSVVILVSPFLEKMHYLNVPVREKILVGQPFMLEDVLSLKKEEKKYLVLVFNEEDAFIYQAHNDVLTTLVHNKKKNISSPTGGEITRESLVKYVYNNLRIVTRAYSLPVVVVGSATDLKLYHQIAKEKTMASIVTSASHSNMTTIQGLLASFLKNWQKAKEDYLLAKLEEAAEKGKLQTGIYDVWKAAVERKTIMLLVEEGYAFPAYLGNKNDLLYADAIPLNSSIQITDAVSDAIEKVLIGGGDVQVVPKGLLSEHLHIALIVA